LERWSVGALERWSVGALGRWGVGALGVGALVSGLIGGFAGLIAFTSGFLLAKAVILGVARAKKGKTG